MKGMQQVFGNGSGDIDMDRDTSDIESNGQRDNSNSLPHHVYSISEM